MKVLVLTLYSLRVTYKFYFKKIHVKISIKTAAEVIDTLHENTLYEIAPEFLKVASVMAAIPPTSCSAESSFSGLRRLKTELRNTMEQHRLDSLAIVCIERLWKSSHCQQCRQDD